MKKIGIFYHPKKKAAFTLSKKLQKFLSSKGLSIWLCSAWETETAKSLIKGTDLILSIGGDGTILRAAQAVVPEPIPITGINLGNLGFMTELSVDEAEEKLSTLLYGKGWIDERSLLEAELYSKNKEQQSPRRLYALNDVVLARGAIARVIYVDASINNKPLTTYKADGVIVATATGSTAYSLAAGGPILHPQAQEFLMLPITPHLSSAYTLVLPATTLVKLHLSVAESATLSVDGHINFSLSDGVVVTIKHSLNTVRFLRTQPDTTFYSSLEQKLKGKYSFEKSRKSQNQ